MTDADRWRGKEWLKAEPLPPGYPDDAKAIWKWIKINAPTAVTIAEIPFLDLMLGAKYRLHKLGHEPGGAFDPNEWLRAVKDAATHYERAAFELRKHLSEPREGNGNDPGAGDGNGNGNGKVNPNAARDAGRPPVPFARRARRGQDQD